MNLLDLIIIIVFLVVFAIAFIAGLWRVLSAIVALWIGLLLADLIGRTFSNFLSRMISGMEPWTAQIWGFLLVMLAVTLVVLYALLYSFRVYELRSGRSLEFQYGIPVIFLTIVFSLLLALVSVTVVIRISDRAIRQMPQEQRVAYIPRQFSESQLAPSALRVSRYVYDVSGRWVPGDTPSLLAPTEQR